MLDGKYLGDGRFKKVHVKSYQPEGRGQHREGRPPAKGHHRRELGHVSRGIKGKE